MTTQSIPKLIGHEWVIDLFRRQRFQNQLPQSVLFVGLPSVGKSSVARYLARLVNCTAPTPPCDTCSSCRKIIAENHPDVIIFDDENTPLKIETIRDIQRAVSLSPIEGTYHVVIFCNFERATTSAANALLKTLEEPPPNAIIMLTAPDSELLLPTIVSRCQPYKLRPLPTAQIGEALQTVWHLPEEQATLLTRLAAGRLGWAIRTLHDEQLLARREQRLGDFLWLFTANRTERMRYAHELSQDSAILRETLLFWITLTRDFLLLRATCQTPITNLDWADKLQPFVGKLTLQQLQQLTTRLRDTLIRLDYNVNPRLNTEILLLKLPNL